MTSNDKTEKKSPENKQKESKRKGNPFVLGGGVVILVILVVTFIAGPALGQMGSSGGRLIFGSYNGKPIEARGDNYFARQRDSIAERVRDNGASDAISMQFQLYQVWRQAFENTVIHTAFLDMADESGFQVSANLVDKEIIANGPYRDAEGNFDEERYSATSNTVRKSNKDYITESLIQDRIVRDVFSSRISKAEIEFIKDMGRDEMKVHYAVFPYSDYPKAEIIAFANAQQDLFREVSLSRIAVFDNEEKALSLAEQLKENPLLFEELARNNSQDSFAEKGGSMGQYAYHELTPFFTETEDLDRIFNMDESQISSVVAGESGWFIYRIDAAATLPSFEDKEMQEKVLAYIQRYERGQVEDYFIAEAEAVRAAVEAEESLIQASRGKAELHETEKFPVIYGSPSFSLYGSDYPLYKQIATADEDATLRNTARDLGFLQAMASLKAPGDISQPIILDEAVVLVELIEKSQASDEELSSTEFYYTYAVNSWKEEALTKRLLSSDKLEDNFYAVFGNLMSEN